jgi:DNA-binding transcriptional MerR regulator
MAARTPGLCTMAEVRRRTGLTERQIRYYETQGLVAPLRSAGRQRLFSLADVERLAEIKRWLDAGLSLKAVRDRLAEAVLPSEEESTDAPGYFRGQRWVRQGHTEPPLRSPVDRSSWQRQRESDNDGVYEAKPW